MTKFALALGIAFAISTAPVTAWAGFDPPNQLAAPFSPNATIYRPDCSHQGGSVALRCLRRAHVETQPAQTNVTWR